MRELLQWVLTISVFVFTVSSMLSLGFAYTLKQVLAPVRDPNTLIRAVVANFVLVPMLAVAIGRALSLEPGIEIGLILLACSAGAPFLVKLTEAADGNLGLSATLLVILVPVSVVFMALVVPWLAPEANVSAGPIARQLVLTLLAPFALGLFVRSRSPRWAMRLQPGMGKTSTIALIVLLVSTVALNLREIVSIGWAPIVAALLLILGAFSIGYLLARPGRGRRTVLALGTAQRGIAAATIVASQDVTDSSALVMVVMTSVVGMIVLFPLARWLRDRVPRAAEPPTGADLAGVGV